MQNQGWGLLTRVTLPGGGKFGIYEPRHARPKPVAPAAKEKNPTKKEKKKPHAK